MDFFNQIISSGKSAVDMVLYLMLPITVVMGGIMKVLENKGILYKVSNALSYVTRWFGASGLSVIALFKMLFVSSVAPLSTLTKLEQYELSRRKLAASLVLVLTATQANVSFTMIGYGLNIYVLLFTSIVGGVAGAAFTFYVVTRHWPIDDHTTTSFEPSYDRQKSIVQSLSEGGLEGMKIAINMLPMLIITIFLMSILKTIHAIDGLTWVLGPIFGVLGLPESAVLPVITKYVAGGTAYMGVMVEQLEQGIMTARELNIISGLASNPMDLVGMAIFAAIGPRIAGVFRAVVIGTVFGLLIRALIHILWFN